MAKASYKSKKYIRLNPQQKIFKKAIKKCKGKENYRSCLSKSLKSKKK